MNGWRFKTKSGVVVSVVWNGRYFDAIYQRREDDSPEFMGEYSFAAGAAEDIANGQVHGPSGLEKLGIPEDIGEWEQF